MSCNVTVEKSDRLADMSENIAHRGALYLFACHLAWRTRRSLAAYQELLRHSTIRTVTFVALQNLSCTEARQGLRKLRRASKRGEVVTEFHP